jgi:hypothetical protein
MEDEERGEGRGGKGKEGKGWKERPQVFEVILI